MQPASDLIGSYEQADALLVAGDLQQAADICRRMLESNPNFAHGYHLMAALFRTTGNLEKARGFSELAISLDPGVALFHMLHGQLLFSLCRYADAARAFNEGQTLEPGNILFLLLRAGAYAQQGKYDDAMALFSQARLLRETPDIDEHEGLCMMAMGETARAEILFDRVISARPGYFQAYIHKGRALLSRDRIHEAEVCFAKALNRNPHSAEALLGLAVVNERQGQLEAAIAVAIQAVGATGPIVASLSLLGQLLLRKQQWAAAEQVFGQALSVVPGNLYLMSGMVGALIPQKKLVTFLPTIESLMAARPENKALAFFSDAVRGREVAMPPEESITGYYNEYATRYDYFLHQPVTYRASMIRDALAGLPPLADKNNLSLLDLGCGAGVCAEALRDITGTRIGVDISARMIDKARARQCYQELYTLGITEFTLGSDRMFDVIVALDVLPHLGDLDPFFSALRNVMAAASVFAFTIETQSESERFRLNANGRYAHAPEYIEKLLSDHGYAVMMQDDALTRFDGDQPIKGRLYIIRKMTIH